MRTGCIPSGSQFPRGGYLCNFIKGSHGIKNYMRVQEEGMGVQEEFVLSSIYNIRAKPIQNIQRAEFCSTQFF